MTEADLRTAMDDLGKAMFGFMRNPAFRWWRLWEPRWISMTDEQIREFIGR